MSDGVDIRRDERGRALELPAALAANKWQKGYAPNPTGKGGEYVRCRSLCREASYESAQEIIRLRDHSDDDRVRFMAATWLYERAWGKTEAYDPKAEQQGPLAFDPSKIAPEKLEEIKRALMALLAASMPAEEPQASE